MKTRLEPTQRQEARDFEIRSKYTHPYELSHVYSRSLQDQLSLELLLSHTHTGEKKGF
jgi:hypothetical protein